MSDPAGEHSPHVSIWPILLALGVTLIAAGILLHWIVSILGLGLLLASLWGWAQENRAGIRHEEDEPEEEEVHE